MSNEYASAFAARFASTSDRQEMLVDTTWQSGSTVLRLERDRFSLDVDHVGYMIEDEERHVGTWTMAGNEIVLSRAGGTTRTATGTMHGRDGELDPVERWQTGMLDATGRLCIAGRALKAQHLIYVTAERVPRRGSWLQRSFGAAITNPIQRPPFIERHVDLVDVGDGIATLVTESVRGEWRYVVLHVDGAGNETRTPIGATPDGALVWSEEREELAVPILRERSLVVVIVKHGKASELVVDLPKRLPSRAPLAHVEIIGAATSAGWVFSVEIEGEVATVNLHRKPRWSVGELVTATDTTALLRNGKTITALDARSSKTLWEAKDAVFRSTAHALYRVDQHRGADRLSRIDEKTGRASWTFSRPKLGTRFLDEDHLVVGLPWSDERKFERAKTLHVGLESVVLLDARTGSVVLEHDDDLGFVLACDQTNIAVRRDLSIECRSTFDIAKPSWQLPVSSAAAVVTITPVGIFVRDSDLRIHPFSS